MTEVTKPPRVVGTLGASLMSINGMIGAGIFALPALLYDKAGHFAPVFAFLAEVTALGAQFITLCVIAAFVLFRLRGHEGHASGLSPFWWGVVANE
jgi:amino acid transporter